MEEHMYEPVMDFFAEHLRAYTLFLKVQEYIHSLGPVKMEVLKTQIVFSTDREFAWVWMPQKRTVNRPASSIIVAFALERLINHERITQSVEANPRHWTHHAELKQAADFDEDVRSWLRESYQWSLKQQPDQIRES